MTPQTVLVLGATGKVGRQVVAGLLDAGIGVRALVRSPLLAGLPAAVALHRGDVHDPASIAAAADGADAAFLLWPGFSADGAAPVVAALAAHVRHVVHLSAGVLSVPDGRPLGTAAPAGVWADVEELVRDSGVAATFLRPGGFAGNTLMWADDVRAGRPVRTAFPDARRSLIHERDIADVAVLALRDPGAHDGRAHLLSGPATLTEREQVAAIGAAVGRTVDVEEEPRSDTAARMAAAGADEAWVASSLDHWASLVAQPEVAVDTVERLTGHPARPFAQWARDHADDFRVLSTAEVADRYARGFRAGDVALALAQLSPDVVRTAPLEGPEPVRGRTAVLENAERSNRGVTIHAVAVDGPFVHGDRFGLRFSFDETAPDGSPRTTTTFSLCTVADGRIVAEEVFYLTPPG